MRVKPSLIIKTLKKNKLCVSETASGLGIHKSTVYRWFKRARTSPNNITTKKLFRKSTKPKTIHFALTVKEKDEAIRTRKYKHQTAEKITKSLSLSCHPSTAHRLFLPFQFGYYTS